MTLDVIADARRRTRRRLTILVLIGVGVLAAAVYSVGGYADSRRADPAVADRPATATPTASADGTAANGGVLPADVVWVRIVGVQLPVSAATGPSDTTGGLARGFARTHAGAVVAALHLLVRTTPQVGPSIFEPTLREQVVGEHADAMRHVVADAYTQLAAQHRVPYGQRLGDLSAAVAGVRIDRYTDTGADLSVLTTEVDSTDTTRYAAAALTLTWSGSDWRLVAPPDGRWDSQVRIVDLSAIGSYVALRAR
jgi:hypothetical protein